MPDRPPHEAADAATQVFVEHRELLFGIVYNLLGSVADTEDVLQDTWLAWAARHAADDAPAIDNPRGYLVRVATNTAVDRRTAISRRREHYVGPWLPEPLVASGDAAEEAAVGTESVSMALLVVLESLSPLERAVFVLHEVFGYPYPEVAEILGRSAAAVRQLGHRAREHVQQRRPRYRPAPEVRRRVSERFIAAVREGDLQELLELLAPDVTMWNDAGGKVPKASMRPVHGGDKVARFFVGIGGARRNLTVRYRTVNGDPAVLLFTDHSPFAVMVLEPTADGDRVGAIYTVANPDKLSTLH